jgi:hypothetical protein
MKCFGAHVKVPSPNMCLLLESTSKLFLQENKITELSSLEKQNWLPLYNNVYFISKVLI